MAAFMSVPNPRFRYLILPELGRIQQPSSRALSFQSSAISQSSPIGTTPISELRSRRGYLELTTESWQLQNKKAGPPPAVTLASKNSGAPYLPLLTTFLSSFPGVNLATLRAAILMVAPVCGFRPLRALRCETENVPNPINATRSPFRRAAVTLSTVVSIAVVAWAFEMLQAPAIRSTRSALFMLSPDTSRYGSRASAGEESSKREHRRWPFSPMLRDCQWETSASCRF